ncbi:Uncharacterised protein [Halioglobus japonicus]|nr:Uncharacterised protein [Halioglobus japonicus]
MTLLKNRVLEFAARKIRVPEDITGLTDIGVESAAPGIEAIWDRALDVYKSGVHPGLQCCIYHQGEVVLERAVGHARGVSPGQVPGADATPMHVDTPVNLFSAAKAVTSILMHKLEGDGVLDLDVPVATYLPGFERHGKGEITLSQILNHRAGIPVLPPEALDLDVLDNIDAIREFVLDMKPTQEVGGAPAYHTISGGFIMDLVVREVTGKGVRDILIRDFKKPLGLKWFDYGVKPAQTKLVAQNAMTGFRMGPLMSKMFQRILGMPWDEVVQLSNDPRFLAGIIPSGNLITTARGIATLYQCMLDNGTYNGKAVLSPSTVAKLVHAPNTHFEVDRMLGMPMRYSNGFMMGTSSFSLYGWNHPHAFGHVGMSNTFTWADPDRNLVVALLTTGKPILGPHLIALPKLIAEIHNTFPTHNGK